MNANALGKETRTHEHGVHASEIVPQYRGGRTRAREGGRALPDIEGVRNLRAAGCSEEGALEQVGISRRRGIGGLAPKSTRPRRVRQRTWKPRDVKAVMDVRRKYPFMGKARIHAMLARKGGHLSVSTVGRIIERALAAGAIRRASFCEGRVKPKRRRSFAKWATRWKYGSKARRPGELVQIDHMTYTDGGQTLKEFRPSARSRSSW